MSNTACPENWTDQDEYNVYPDCHVWAPFYLIIDGFVIVTAFVCFIFASCKTCRSRGSTKVIAGVITVQTLGMSLCYTVRLWTGLVTGHRNVALNFFYGISLGAVWVVYGLATLQYLEVVLQTEKLKGKSETVIKRMQFVFRFFMIGTFLGCVSGFFFASVYSHLRIEITYWVLAIIAIAVYTLVIWYSGIMVRNLLTSMEVSQTFYKRMVRKLDFFLVPWTICALPLMISMIVILVTPVFMRNMYIMFGFISWLAEFAMGLILLSISGSIYGSSTGRRRRPKGQKHKDAVREAKLAAAAAAARAATAGSKQEHSTSAPLSNNTQGSPDRTTRTSKSHPTITTPQQLDSSPPTPMLGSIHISIPHLQLPNNNNNTNTPTNNTNTITNNIILSSEPTTPISPSIGSGSSEYLIPALEKEEDEQTLISSSTNHNHENHNHEEKDSIKELQLLTLSNNNNNSEILSPSSTSDLDQSRTTSNSNETLLEAR